MEQRWEDEPFEASTSFLRGGNRRSGHEARPHIDKARALITATGYHRSDEELAALERDLAQAGATPPPGA